MGTVLVEQKPIIVADHGGSSLTAMSMITSTQNDSIDTLTSMQSDALGTKDAASSNSIKTQEEKSKSHQSAEFLPKVRYKVEYRELKDGTLLNTQDNLRRKVRKKAHEGPVFDVVDVNYTSETQGTRKSDRAVDKTEKSDADKSEKTVEIESSDNEKNDSPSVQMSGSQYIRIYSHAIINALQCVVNYYPYRPVVGDPIDIKEPYPILVHHWEQLEEFRQRFNPSTVTGLPNDCTMADTYEHVGYLLEFLETKMGDKVRKERERWKKAIPTVSFEMLWLLLRPGIDVCYDEDRDKAKEPWIVADVSFDVLNQSWSEYKLRVWNLNCDDDLIVPDEESYTISRFHGEKPISELDVFPSEYLEDYTTWREQMIQRGKLLFNFRQKKCMYYDGEGDFFPRLPFKGYVMLDPAQEREDLGREINDPDESVDRKPSGLPFCYCNRCSNMETQMSRPAKFKGYERIEINKIQELTDHQYLICTRSTRAFVLGIRQWKRLFVSGFSEPKWNKGLIDELVIKPHFKKMLQNLTKMFIEQQKNANAGKQKSDSIPTPWTADFVESKGKGLVFLLHGKPGVGKTYTAECIAQYVQRPLLAVTCADIGIGPSKIEENLRGWFKKAHRWDAIMLLDEADVYMEYRQIHDLSRNNLVAGFLRAIEYYEGVLFLTTNRIGTFDEAFLSRINVSLYYPDFGEKDREKIWYNYFDKLERERGDEICVLYGTKEYATKDSDVKKLEWNGREIRNAFQIAVNLAQAEGHKDEKGRYVVKREHIQVTAELSQDFKDYMVSIHKKTESQRATIMGYRYDPYSTPNKQLQEFH